MRQPWLVRGDIDGFFGLFIDNLLQLMLIGVLCEQVGLGRDLVVGRILPGAALSILVGNLFYTWQARRLMQRTGRTDVTALPYGINTVSLVAYIFLIMAPVQAQYKDATLTWRVGLFACLMSGIMEVLGAFVGDWLRRHTPRAALLSALAGIAIAFIAMGFVFQIFASPLLAIFPMMLILASYAGQLKLPLGLPGGFVAVAIGVGIAWVSRAIGYPLFQPASGVYQVGLHLPRPAVGDALALLADERGWRFMAVIIPMGLFNVIGSLQNLESAEAAGDRFETKPSLLVNGIGSLVAAFFGSAFPPTIYIGHPGWKAMGARAGYSAMNGIVISVLCLVGGVSLVLRVVPLEAALGILLWIGIIITAQAFQEVPRRHALAVALGLVPSLAAWALVLIETSLRVAGSSLYKAAGAFGADLYIYGVIALSQGSLLTAMVLAAVLVHVIERQFLRAAAWCVAASAMSAVGLMHAYTLTPAGVQNRFHYYAAAPRFAIAYLLVAGMMVTLHVLVKEQRGDQGALSTEYQPCGSPASQDSQQA